MIKSIFILKFLSARVTAVEQGGDVSVESSLGDPAGGAVKFLCEREFGSAKADASTLIKFNELVTQYLVENFGHGGRKYLEFFRTGAREGETKSRGCVGMPSDVTYDAYMEEMRKIESDLGVPKHSWLLGLGGTSFSSKSSLPPRFRVHRFLGILALCKNSPQDERCWSAKALFPSSVDWKGLDRALGDFKKLTQMTAKSGGKGSAKWSGIAVAQIMGSQKAEKKEHLADPTFTDMVRECLRLVEVIKYGNEWDAISLALGYYKQNCTYTKESLVKTKTCEVLPRVLKSANSENFSRIAYGLNLLFEMRPNPLGNEKTVHDYLKDVLTFSRAWCDIEEILEVDHIVEEIIEAILDGDFKLDKLKDTACWKRFAANSLKSIRGEPSEETCESVGGCNIARIVEREFENSDHPETTNVVHKLSVFGFETNADVIDKAMNFLKNCLRSNEGYPREISMILIHRVADSPDSIHF
jgi:hypothetical protein